MQLLIEISIFLFALGAAAVFGGFFHQRTEKSKDITNGMFLGSLVALGGYLLALLLTKIEYGDKVDPTTHTWVVIAILVVLAALAFFYRKERKSQPLIWLAAGALSAAALAIEFVWPI